MSFTDLLNHNFMICDKSSKLYFARRAQPGPRTCYPDGCFPDEVYDSVLLLALIGIDYCLKTEKMTHLSFLRKDLSKESY